MPLLGGARGVGAGIDGGLAGEQENTVADTPLQDLMSWLLHMLEEAAGRAGLGGGGGGGGPRILHQLVIILGDGHIHEKEKLRRLVSVSPFLLTLLLKRPPCSPLALLASACVPCIISSPIINRSPTFFFSPPSPRLPFI